MEARFKKRAAELGQNLNECVAELVRQGLEVDTEPQTLADLFAGRVGRVNSGGRETLSDNAQEQFTDYLEAKRQAGRL